jgi:hypothetical protein
MFDQFPKKRPVLPEEIQEIYTLHYKQNRGGATIAGSLSKLMEGWLHKQIAKDLVDLRELGTTLEIGAGTLNHLLYEPEVSHYDIVEPFEEFYNGSSFLNRIRNIYSDIGEIPEEQKYNRIISIATFEHICDLPRVIAKSGILLKENGSLRVSIPSEGSPLWGLAQKLTTGLEFKIRYGLNYSLLMKHEHVNTAKEVEKLLCYFFGNVESHVLGINKSFSFYQFYACTEPDIEKCYHFLNGYEERSDV